MAESTAEGKIGRFPPLHARRPVTAVAVLTCLLCGCAVVPYGKREEYLAARRECIKGREVNGQTRLAVWPWTSAGPAMASSLPSRSATVSGDGRPE